MKGGPVKDETVRANRGQGVADQFEVVGIDAALLLVGKLRRILQMYQEVEITEEEYRRELAETKGEAG
jgi:hypothetical protein